MARFFRIVSWIALVAVALIFLQQSVQKRDTQSKLDFTSWLRLVGQNKVSSLTIYPKNKGEG